MNNRFVRFLIVGVVGFVVDGGGTWLFVKAGVAPVLARIVPLAAAILVTWLLNRSHTFRTSAPKSGGELVRYSTVALSSAALNYLLYAGLVHIGVPVLLAVALATCILAVYSFVGYRNMVFR